MERFKAQENKKAGKGGIAKPKKSTHNDDDGSELDESDNEYSEAGANGRH